MKAAGVHHFADVVNDLEAIARDVLRGRKAAIPDCVSEDDLHGAFRQSTTLQVRQRFGAFFTGQQLSRQVLRHAPASGTVCDIACGTGSLLLTHTDRMRLASTLDETLDYWGERLVGREVQEQLLRVARARIVIAAARKLFVRQRTACRTSRRYDDLLPQLRRENGLKSTEVLASATDVVLNPPFTKMVAPKECPWGDGTINSAAWFVHHCLQHAREGARVTAVLPDVLRSGERYGRWRAFVESVSKVEGVESVGRFDQHADVDVFVLRLMVRRRDGLQGMLGAARWVAKPADMILGDFFNVTVGSLVSYRTKAEGPWQPYLDVAGAEPWGRVSTVDRSRRFLGRLQAPPFVVVRRTSSPSDRNRAIPTLVTGRKPIAVENHLLVLEPLDQSVDRCREAVEILARAGTNEWLNDRIRCRHLTVDSVREIPWKLSG